MKILFSSYVFSPSVGGIETVAALLAPEFVRSGHEVALVTLTGEDDGKSWPFAVQRSPGPAQLLELTRWCDVFFQNNISLQLAWPLLFVRRPWIISHSTWIDRLGARGKLRDQLKRFLLPYGVNVTVSRAVAHGIPVASTIVGNPYSDDIFRQIPGITRDRELIFVGRLVSDKGVDLLIQSLADLRALGLSPRLTIAGSGPEEPALRLMAANLGVANQIEFAGSKEPREIARLLNAHQVLVVPSRWAEPFGIVVLEGLGCGCAVIAARMGGLPEAVGSCGLLFATDNPKALTEALHTMLTQPATLEKFRQNAGPHLGQFQTATVAARYLEVFERARLASHAHHLRRA
ncbi:MAG TPA: glycosyltransferase family 4 protein [Candidatus Methylacidiphilales bacterium]|nr:glycosyltransferase family 4 protein [Candidatus Methylacidiphilales bacterium]